MAPPRSASNSAVPAIWPIERRISVGVLGRQGPFELPHLGQELGDVLLAVFVAGGGELFRGHLQQLVGLAEGLAAVVDHPLQAFELLARREVLPEHAAEFAGGVVELGELVPGGAGRPGEALVHPVEHPAEALGLLAGRQVVPVGAPEVLPILVPVFPETGGHGVEPLDEPAQLVGAGVGVRFLEPVDVILAEPVPLLLGHLAPWLRQHRGPGRHQAAPDPTTERRAAGAERRQPPGPVGPATAPPPRQARPALLPAAVVGEGGIRPVQHEGHDGAAHKQDQGRPGRRRVLLGQDDRRHHGDDGEEEPERRLADHQGQGHRPRAAQRRHRDRLGRRPVLVLGGHPPGHPAPRQGESADDDGPIHRSEGGEHSDAHRPAHRRAQPEGDQGCTGEPNSAWALARCPSARASSRSVVGKPRTSAQKRSDPTWIR